MAIRKGARAPDFSLLDQSGQMFRLSSLRGKRVVLSFHPLAFTSVCGKQMKELEKNRQVFFGRKALALGISVDHVPAKAAWAKMLKIRNTSLLADFWPHGAVARRYGIFRPEGFSERAVFVVDEKGKLTFAKVYPMAQVPPMKEILAALKM
jgi:peroxiredoxin